MKYMKSLRDSFLGLGVDLKIFHNQEHQLMISGLAEAETKQEKPLLYLYQVMSCFTLYVSFSQTCSNTEVNPIIMHPINLLFGFSNICIYNMNHF